VFFGKLNAIDLVTGFLPYVGSGREGFMNVNGLVSALPWLRYINLSMWGGGAWTVKKEGLGTGIIFFGTDSVTTDWDFSPSFNDGVGILFFTRKYYKVRDKLGYFMFVAGGSTKEYASNDPHDWLDLPGTGGPVSTANGQPWSTAYYLSQDVWQDPCNKSRKMNFLLAGSLADSNPSFSNWNVVSHLEAYGLNPSRPGDRMGVSGWYNGLTDEIIQLAADNGDLVRDNWGVELYYNREITPWFHLTADLQVLRNSNQNANTGLVPGFRGIIDF
jgi:porin